MTGEVNTDTIRSALEEHLEDRSSNALQAPGYQPCPYDRLLDQVDTTVTYLNEAGVGRNDRVAIVLPNGPLMASTFLAVSAGMTAAPLNPAYRESEFEFYLSDLGARAIILSGDADSPARAVADRLGIPIFTTTDSPRREAGLFTIEGEEGIPTERGGFAEPDDTALILHTSGTTSRPKIVPLTQSNICASARNIHDWLHLTSGDLCLNVMPLFHIHGLMGVLLSSLISGAGVVCTPGFDSDRFFDWMRDFSPTWYSAVPTMHQAVATAVREDPTLIDGVRLRFLRSSSASLPPAVMEELEERFGAPLVEAYGMTEAAHQMASNPLPPGERKPGTVGTGTGVEIAIMDDAGTLLPGGSTGEIVIRGPNVTAGYENNPTANDEAFTDEWFRTGDQGVLDEDGYLTITGRLKEIINRGGEKISPREVDETLLTHPAVAQAVAFAVPHSDLGEDLVAAVILRPGMEVSEKEIRLFTAESLAEFKVPSQILFVREIPKGPTGKLQRIGLHERLADLMEVGFVAPEGETETAVASVWQEVLGLDRVGVSDNFFRIGGDSLKATRIAVTLSDRYSIDIPLLQLFSEPTIAGLAGEIDRKLEDQGNGATMDRILAELEGMTDEEAERLLGGYLTGHGPSDRSST